MTKPIESLNWLKKNKILIFILIIILSVFYYSYNRSEIIDSLIHQDTNSVIEFVNSFGFLSIIIFTILVIIEVVVAPIPSVILYAAGGIIFGTFLGGTAALIGNIVGAIIAFKIAQKYGRRFIEKKADKKRLVIFDKFSKKYGSYAIFLLRINPLTSSDIFSYLAGLSRISLKQLVLGTALGLAPLVYIQAYIGEDFIRNNPILFLLFIFISVAYIAVFFYGIYRLKNKK